MKNTKTKLISSVAVLLICFAMLIGSTFAWFTDSASTGVNKIQAGNLDVQVEFSQDGTTWANLEGTDSLFSNNLWEPGHTEFAYLRIKNNGSLAFKYKVLVSPITENEGINKTGNPFKLSDYLVFATTNLSDDCPNYGEGSTGRENARAAAGNGVSLNQPELIKEGTLLPNTNYKYLSLVVYMPETIENEANARSVEEAPYINLGINVIAGQFEYEFDSFGNDYDGAAEYPGGSSASNPQYGVVERDIVREEIQSGQSIVFNSNVAPSQDVSSNTKVTIPEGTVGFDAGNTSELKVEASPTITANSLFEIKANQSAVGAIDLTATVYDTNTGTTQTVSQFKDLEGNPKTVLVESDIAKNLTNLSLTYGDEVWSRVENVDDVIANTFYYDPNSGHLVFGTTHFSTFIVHADENFYVNSIDTAYKNLEDALTNSADGDYVVLLKDCKTRDTQILSDASVTLDLNDNKLTLNADIELGYTRPVEFNITNGNILALNSVDEYTIRYDGGSKGSISNVTFTSGDSSRSKKVLSVYSSSRDGVENSNNYKIENCTFDNVNVKFGGASGDSYSFNTEFKNCNFINQIFVSGYDDSVVYYDSYLYGSAKFDECYFDITSIRNGSSAATAIRSDVYSGNVGSNKLNIVVNDVTIEGKTANSNSTFYPIIINQETNANCSTIVTKTGDNVFLRNGKKATMTANTAVYSVKYKYNNTDKADMWSTTNGNLIYATNSYSKYFVEITLLEDSEENIVLNGQKLVVPSDKVYSGNISAANGYILLEENGENREKIYSSVQAEFNGVKCTLTEAQKSMQEAGTGTIKLLTDNVSFSNAYKLATGMIIDLNGHVAKNKPTPSTNYALKLENDIYTVVPAVAKVNTQYFATLNEAVNAVTINNPTITLLADSSENLTLPINITNRAKFDTNGKNYTGKVTVDGDYMLLHDGNIFAIAVTSLRVGSSDPIYFTYDKTPKADTEGTALNIIYNATEDCVLDILIDYNHVTLNGLWCKAPEGHTLTVNTNGYTVTGGVNASSGNTRVDNGNGTYTITRN